MINSHYKAVSIKAPFKRGFIFMQEDAMVNKKFVKIKGGKEMSLSIRKHHIFKNKKKESDKYNCRNFKHRRCKWK